MKKNAFIYDFDNTVFPVKTIGPELFAPLFELLEKDEKAKGELDDIKEEVMRQPFQKIAEKHGLSKELTEECQNLLRELTYNKPIQPFDDFYQVTEIPGDRFLVTMGFMKMQTSKINASGVRASFKEVIVIDPEETNKIKIDIFREIIEKYGYEIGDVYIIGDDPESEIQAGMDLGATAILYDPEGLFPDNRATHTIKNYSELAPLVQHS